MKYANINQLLTSINMERPFREKIPLERRAAMEWVDKRTIREPTTGCWLWVMATNTLGYGRVGKSQNAYRLIYEVLVGKIPSGFELDHKCRVPACVNPDHLDPVTHQINVRRGVSSAAQNAKKILCLRGHSLLGTNVRHHPASSRICKICEKEESAKRYEKYKGLGSIPRTRPLQTHCKYGHELSEENTARASLGRRMCRICRNARSVKQYAARKSRNPTH